MTFTQEVKLELMQKSWEEKEFNQFLQGIIFAIGTKKTDNYHFTIHNQRLFEIICFNIKIFKFQKHFRIKGNNFQIAANFFEFSLRQIETFIKAFLIGIFLAHGSISCSEKSRHYHLEIMFKNSAWQFLKTLLQEKQIYLEHIKRGSLHILYLKKAEFISDFLKFLGANQSVLKFEDVRIQRDFNNNLNRIGNLDVYNQNRISNLSFALFEAIKQIELAKKKKEFSAKIRVFMNLKKQFPYDSLQALAIKMKKKGIKITKSGLNHWSRKIKDFANNL